MGSLDNRFRRKWQDYGGSKAINAEHSFIEVFSELFKDTEYEVVSQPTDFKNLYVDVTLRSNVKMVGLKVSRALPVEVMLMRDCVSTSLLVFLVNFVLKAEFQNQTFLFGLYSRVILQETHVEFEKSPIGSRISRPITSFGETAQ